MGTEPARVAGIDIDGVLADPSHRLHFVEGRPKNWKGFFAQAHRDPTLPEGIEVVRALVERGVAIVYVTGRPEYLRRLTSKWLEQQGLPADVMHMRPRGDFRPAPEVKLGIYRRIAAEFEIEVIVDDDTRVVDTLRSAGFPVHLADWFVPDPAGKAALQEAQDEKGRS